MSTPFKEAVEARDWDAAMDCLAPDVTFNSPVAHRPFEGKEAVSGVLRAVSETFEDFTVMVRPASGLMALGEAMGPKVAGLKA